MSVIELVDTRQFGRAGVGCAYLVSGRARALIDAGPAGSIETVAAAVARSPIETLCLTHVHPDHAGAAGGLAERLPRLRVGVHARGRRHLLDPSSLNASIREWTGPLAARYGDVLAVPAPQIVPLAEGDRLDLGNGVLLEVIDAPGHAPHHLCFLERSEGALFCGDALGIRRGDMLVPATVPPRFDLEQSLATATKLAALEPRTVYFSHFGPREATEALFEGYARALVDWIETMEALRRRLSGPEVARTLAADRPYRSLSGDLRAEFEMCVRGALHFLERRAGTADARGSGSERLSP